MKSTSESLSHPETSYGRAAGGNCVVARRGGEQPEADLRSQIQVNPIRFSERNLLFAGGTIGGSGTGERGGLVRLTAHANGYTGELSARWSAVPNKKFYEVQATPLDGSASAAVSDDLPTLPVSRSKIELKGFVPGSLVGIRVRAVGAKGVGPWCDPITARV